MIADMLTRPLSSKKFEDMLDEVGVIGGDGL